MNDVFKVVNGPILLVHVIQARNLYEPAHVVRELSVVDDPLR